LGGSPEQIASADNNGDLGAFFDLGLDL